MTGQGKGEIDLILAESLKALAAKKPIEKITIKEITDKAGVIRPTFYNHFQDKYELLEWIINRELLEPVRPLVLGGRVKEAVMQLFASMLQDKAFYSRAARMDGVITFDAVAHKCLKEMFLTVIQDLMTTDKIRYVWLTPDRIASYYAQSLCFMIKAWIMEGMVIPPQEIADTYQYIMTHSMEEILREL